MVLDIGCGKHKIEHRAVGIDCQRNTGVDIVCNLNSFPWPIRDSVATRIYLSHILEHLHDVTAALAEVHRIACPSATVLVTTPHFSSCNSWIDPTHKQHLSCFSFDYFTGDDFERFSVVPFRFRIVERQLTFGKNFILDGVGRYLANRNLRWYERHAAWVFPALDIQCTLEVIKSGQLPSASNASRRAPI